LNIDVNIDFILYNISSNYEKHVPSQFYQRNGRPYKVSEGDQLFIEIILGSLKMPCTISFASKADASGGGSGNNVTNIAKVSFTVHKSGQYRIVIMVAGAPMKGSPFTKTFLPGAMQL
jgi:hypothetical protein